MTDGFPADSTTACTVCDTALPVSSRFCPSCGTPVPGPGGTTSISDPANEQLLRLRRVLAGRFEVLEELGRGGMASVYRARQISLDRELAVKVLNAGLNPDSDLVQRFLREARTQGRLEHPGIIPVYEVYQEAGLSFYTMPRIQGPSLRLFLRDNPRPEIPTVRRLLREACEALGYAHSQGLIHRDVKPENMLMDAQRGRLILTDFGIAKTLSSMTMLTMTGEQLGTPRYMAPDQGDTKQPLDGRSDQYSLGLVAYEMLTGRMAFHADNLAELMYKHRYEEAEPLAEHRPDAPAGLVAAIMRAISKDREERFATMEEFADALSRDEAPVVAGAAIGAGAPAAAGLRPAASAASGAAAGSAAASPPNAEPPRASIPPPPTGTKWRDQFGGHRPLPPFLGSVRKGRRFSWRWMIAAAVVWLIWQAVSSPGSWRKRAQAIDPSEQSATVPDDETPSGGVPGNSISGPATAAPLAGAQPLAVPEKATTPPLPGAPNESADWVKALRSFQGVEAQVDSTLNAVMPAESVRVGRLRARAESLAASGDLPRALGVLGEAAGDLRRSGRRAVQLKVAANLAESAATRARATAERSGAAKRNEDDLAEADELLSDARELRDDGQYVEAEKGFRAATKAFEALNKNDAQVAGAPGPGTAETSGSPGSTGSVPSANPPSPSSPAQEPPAVVVPPPVALSPEEAAVQAEIDDQLDRFGAALASADLKAIRGKFPRLTLTPAMSQALKAIFDRAEHLTSTRLPGRITGTGQARSAEADYELGFAEPGTQAAGHERLALRFTFAKSYGAWRMLTVVQR